MALPALPVQGQNPWYIPRTAWDTAVEAELASLKTRDKEMTSDEWGVGNPSLTPAQRAQSIQDFWNYTALNGLVAVMLPGDYVVDIYTGRPRSDGVLTIPANSDLRFRKGCKIRRTPFQEGTVLTFSRLIVAYATSSDNATLSGVLELDGAGDTVTWYNEHNHCLFIYGAKNLDARGLHLISRNAMGDNLSFSGPSNDPTLATRNCWVGSVELYTARRKSLVIESTINCGIEVAWVENATNDACVDYEPFGLTSTGDMATFRLGTLYCRGSVDITGGTTRTVRNAVLTGDTWTITSRAGQTRPPYFSYGVNLQVGMISIDARRGAHTTGDLFSLAHTTFFNVSVLDIVTPAGYTGTAFKSSYTASGTPTLNINSLRLSGAGDLKVDIGCVGTVSALSIYGADSASTQITLGGSPSPNTESVLQVGSIQFVNAYNAEALIVPNALAAGLRSVRVGAVELFQSDSRVTPALYKALTLGNNSRVIIGDLNLRGGGVTAITSVFPGGIPGIRVKSFPEEFHYHGTSTTWTPEGIYAAPAGTRVLNVIGGKMWIKTTDGTLNTGWAAV